MKPTKKALQQLLAIAVEASRDANPEFDRSSEGESLTLVRLELQKQLPSIVAGATGATEEQATAAIERAKTALTD